MKDREPRQQSQMQSVSSYETILLIVREKAREWEEASRIASGHQTKAARHCSSWEVVITVAISVDEQNWFMMSNWLVHIYRRSGAKIGTRRDHPECCISDAITLKKHPASTPPVGRIPSISPPRCHIAVASSMAVLPIAPRVRPFMCRSCAKALRRRRRTYATASTTKPELYDVVCVGGGPAGLSLLTALRMLYAIPGVYGWLIPRRSVSRYLLPQTRSCRVPRSFQNIYMVPSSPSILQSGQLTHSFI